MSRYDVSGSLPARVVSSTDALPGNTTVDPPPSLVGKGRDRTGRQGTGIEATVTLTEGHTLAPPPSHLTLKQLCGLIFERQETSRPHSKQVAVPGSEPRTV